MIPVPKQPPGAPADHVRQKLIPPLYAIANLDTLLDPLGYVKMLFEAGISLIQLRAKKLPESELERITTSVLELRHTAAPQAAILLNDYVELCRSTGADGVHLGQTDMNPQQARALLGPGAMLGLSTHSLKELRRIPQSVLTYAALGPIYHSPTKQGHADVVGTGVLRRAAAESALPLVAIGGITASRAEEVYTAGAASIAGVSDLQTAAAESAAALNRLVARYLQAAGAHPPPE